MALWKDPEHTSVPTGEWFASLLEKTGFKPESLFTQGQTHVAEACGFVFRLGHDYLEAVGPIVSGVRHELMKQNAHGFTDLYDDGVTVVMKSPDALYTFRSLLDRGDTLTEELRNRMSRAYARGEREVRERLLQGTTSEALHLAPVGVTA